MKLGMLHYTQRTALDEEPVGRECVEGSRLKLIRQDAGGRTVLEFTDGTWACCLESLDDLAAAYEALIRRAALGPAGWESAPVV